MSSCSSQCWFVSEEEHSARAATRSDVLSINRKMSVLDNESSDDVQGNAAHLQPVPVHADLVQVVGAHS
jgi:thiamine biosynthesis lipoprotein ApbE